MSYAIITVPAAPVRKKPNHRSEMTNQLLFGEAVKILKRKKEKWLKVQSLTDGYIGWLTHHLITVTDKDTALQPTKKLAASFYSSIRVNGVVMNIPQGASMVGLAKKHGGFDDFKYECSNDIIELEKVNRHAETLIANAYTWLNAPYLWGGRTVLGVDCSGFAQLMYQLIGVQLPRDAWQQAQEGTIVKKLEEAQPGDLAFFDDKDEIVHVGILLSPNQIIHAAGKVRIDAIDKKGIIHNESGKRTHRLSLLKRIL